MSLSRVRLLDTLRCPRCHGELSNGCGNLALDKDLEHLNCARCQEIFPIIDGIPRLLLPPFREVLLESVRTKGTDDLQVQTAISFGFEWSRFPEMYKEWKQSFLNYMQPHGPDFFAGRKVLDAGCGNGRFAYYAAKYGAEVWALDLGPAVEVAHRNTEMTANTQVVQADLHQPPFALESFDFIYSIGVLHHLPDPEAAFQNLLRYLKPGGEIQIYLYWKPERQPIKRALLAAIAAARKVTTRLPRSAILALSFPAALAAFGFFVWPYLLLKRIPGGAELAAKIPMKQYADFPFRVCVNDQFDRLSAPIENRYTRQEVAGWLSRAGLEGINISAAYGWVGTGRKPVI